MADKKIFRWSANEGCGGIVLANSEDEAAAILNANLPNYWIDYKTEKSELIIWEAELDDDGEFFKKSGILICY